MRVTTRRQASERFLPILFLLLYLLASALSRENEALFGFWCCYSCFLPISLSEVWGFGAMSSWLCTRLGGDGNKKIFPGHSRYWAAWVLGFELHSTWHSVQWTNMPFPLSFVSQWPTGSFRNGTAVTVGKFQSLPPISCCPVSPWLSQDYCGMAWSVLIQRFKNGLFSSHADEHRLK